jgi:glycosyltransferase involved in cell wall biosynthesis
VFAESNAVGTPVISHDAGAAREILNDSRQIVDCRDIEGICRRIAAWRHGERPLVGADDRFRLSGVVEEWRRLLG